MTIVQGGVWMILISSTTLVIKFKQNVSPIVFVTTSYYVIIQSRMKGIICDFIRYVSLLYGLWMVLIYFTLKDTEFLF